jgi:hypothetical protein
MITTTIKRIHRRLLLRAAIVAACVALSCGAGQAADALSLTFQEKDRAYDIQGSFYVANDASVVWDVLTGYEHIPQFVGSLKRSHVEEDLGPYHFLLEQEFEGGFLFFTKRVRVLLDVHETWYQSINFTDIDHKDFWFYEGSWQLVPDPSNGLKIIYTLKAKQNFDAPFAGDYMRGGVKDLLNAVRREILRRQAQEQAKLSAKHLITQSPDPVEGKNQKRREPRFRWGLSVKILRKALTA